LRRRPASAFLTSWRRGSRRTAVFGKPVTLENLRAKIDRGAPDPGARALNAYDEFLAILDDSDQRKQLSTLGMEEARESQLFARIAELGKEFEAGLLTPLFDDPELRRWVRDYLIF
jgi:hypothetical protein